MYVMTECLLEELTPFYIADNQKTKFIMRFPNMRQLNDYRAEFSRWWSKEMRAVKFPSQGTVFDYFIDSETKKFSPWSEKMVPFELEPDVPLQVCTSLKHCLILVSFWTSLFSHMTHCVFQTVLVHTPETICLTYFMDLLLQRGKPIMLVGNAGVGKTILVTDKVAKLKEDYMVAKVPFNYYTTSAMLQRKNHNEREHFKIDAS